MSQFLWFLEFPQNVVGLLLRMAFRQKPRLRFRDAVVVNLGGSWGAFTVCDSIFTDETYFRDDTILRHEYGHRMQSQRLLIFYLFVIVIPSLVWAGCFEGYRQKHQVSYYSFYTEAWANKLDHVTDLK
ncbi:MAG: hypothetical protein P4L75_00750 [Clostridia bacterium]|nr:hypothetical protein [Clostridia bacterium]MDR3645026.1 hypothetical protein [Clostridia bacterium]